MNYPTLASFWRRAALAGLALAAVVTAGCSNVSTQSRGKEGPRRPAVAVRTAHPQRISLERKVELSGTLISPDQAKVSSEVAGAVREVLIELGHEVKPGQVIVRLDTRELDIALRRSEGLMHQTEAQLGIDGIRVKEPPPDEQIPSVKLAMANRDDAQLAFERAQRLSRQGLLAQSDLDAAQTKLKVNQASYETALESVHSLKASLQDRRAAYELAQKKLNDATIRAPVAGQISERLVQPGEYIRENTVVVSIVQMSPLKLKTAVQERNATAVRLGLPVRFQVEPYPLQDFNGNVAFISPSIDQTTRTFVVEVLVDNSRRQLRPGLFAKGVILVRRDDNVLAIPEETVSTLAGVSTVYVIENGKVRQQLVTIGERQDKLLEVVDGLKGGETLSASNLSQLATGVPVETKMPATTEAPQ